MAQARRKFGEWDRRAGAEVVCRFKTRSFNPGNHFRDPWDLSLSITKVLIFPGSLVRYGSSRIVTLRSWAPAECRAMPIKIKDLLTGQRIAPRVKVRHGNRSCA